MSTKVTLFIDPTCPYAWITSRWLLEAVSQSEDFEAEFSIMSLYVLNEGRDLPAGYRAHINKTYEPAHLFIAALREHGQDAFQKLYSAWGERFHVQGRKEDWREVATESLAEVGLPAELIEQWDAKTYDAELREVQKSVQQMVGDDVGTPVISFGSGTAYFGPVLTRAPKGSEALALLEGVHKMSTVRGFAELKRARDGELDFS